jgi:hypothetical protein
MAREDALDIFGSDPFGRDYLYGLSTDRDRLGLAPARYLEEGQNISQGTVKRKGYFGEIPTNNDSMMTEFSSAFEVGGKTVQYPLVVPTLTADELNLLRLTGEATPEIQKKAQEFALNRLSRGLDPFATTQELRYPLPENLDSRPLNKVQDGLFSSKAVPEQTATSSISNSLIDFLLQKFNAQLFPTAAKTLIETVQGNKEPITEKNFSPEELVALKNLIALTNNRGNVQYEDYLNLMKKEQQEKGTIPMSINPSPLSVLDPIGNVQTTLGRFTYTRDANGNLIVVDKYDFNPIPSFSGAYGAIRNYAGEKIPKGSGREVMINLGNADPFGNTIGSSIR